MNRAPTVDVNVDSLVAGGEGVARDGGGRVTFVPGTAPGDRVKVRVLKTTSTYARAEVVELSKAGPSRVEPVCPHAMHVGARQPAPVCGGCQWQHVSRDEQLAAKLAIVTGALNGWIVLASDIADHAELVADAAAALARHPGPFDAIALDPPRVGAPEAIEGIVRHSPPVIVYVSCDVATLARDAMRLVGAGYRATHAYPLDLMPQTSHVEVVMRLGRLVSGRGWRDLGRPTDRGLASWQPPLHVPSSVNWCDA